MIDDPVREVFVFTKEDREKLWEKTRPRCTHCGEFKLAVPADGSGDRYKFRCPCRKRVEVRFIDLSNTFRFCTWDDQDDPVFEDIVRAMEECCEVFHQCQ